MAEMWEYIASYNPQGFYEDNRSKMLSNEIRGAQANAANRENQRQAKIMGLQDALAGGDKSALKALGVYSPETTKKYIENTDEMLSIMRPFAQAVMRTAPENREKAYQQMYQFGINNNIDMSDVPASYDEVFVSTIANSDPQKLRDERLHEQTKERDTIAFGRDMEKLRVAHEYSEESAENAFNRDIRKLQYAYDRADKKTQEAVDWLTETYNMGNNNGVISQDKYIQAMGKILGVDLDTTSSVERKREQAEELGLDYLLGNTTPEQAQDYISRQQALTQAKSTKTGETPAQQMERLRKAGFTAESVQQAVMSGDASLLVPDTTPKGNISANTQGNNNYQQWLSQNPNATPEEQRNARYQYGVPNYDDANTLNLGKIEAQNQGRLDVVNAQGQNAINLENTKQDNRIALADVNEANAENLENLKQKNRVALRYIDDKISQGKELRDLNNAKSLAEFKNSLPTEKMIELANTANYLQQNGFDVTADQLLAREYENALKTAEIDRQYKQAQTEKALREKQTELQQNAQWLVDNGVVGGLGEAVNLLKTKKTSLGNPGDVVNGVTLTGNDAYDETMLKEKAKNDAEDKKNKAFVQNQAKQLKPILEKAYKAAKNGEGIGYIRGRASKYLGSSKKAASNIAAITTLMNSVGPTMIAKLKEAGAGARSFDSEGERQTYLPDFTIYQDNEVLASTIKEFAEKMLGIKLKEER